ncbi:MAG: hypothetical protein K2N03_04485, partial [Muribaculaceae bacterium]|nr:hypothetical protein [Muribaculaceae bacterium]
FILNSGCSQTRSVENSEETTAEIEAAIMEGRNTAKSFVTKNWRDTMELQNHLLEAKSIQSKYVKDKKTRCAQAFDSAFVETMKTVRPELARQLSPYLKNKRK